MSEAMGLRSDELRAALTDALAGRTSRLGDLLARHGGLPGPRPNLTLASAFGDAVSGAHHGARRVLDALREEPDEDSARTFLPIAAAYGYAARLASDPQHAWTGIFELAADERTPVRVGLTSALSELAARGAGNVDAIVAHAGEWLDHDDLDHVFASIAIVLDVLAERRALEGLEDESALFAWLERVIASVADAPRAAERSQARRHVLAALPGALAQVASSRRDGVAWLTERVAEATHPDLRAAMDKTIDALRKGSRAESASVIEALREALKVGAKPPRDPTLIRTGSRGRGKKSKRRGR